MSLLVLASLTGCETRANAFFGTNSAGSKFHPGKPGVLLMRPVTWPEASFRSVPSEPGLLPCPLRRIDLGFYELIRAHPIVRAGSSPVLSTSHSQASQPYTLHLGLGMQNEGSGRLPRLLVVRMFFLGIEQRLCGLKWNFYASFFMGEH